MDARKIAPSASARQSFIQPKAQKLWRYCAGTIALVTMLALAGCYGPPLSPRENDTLIGGAVGLGGGALVGSAVGSPGTGAVIGGLLGAGGGYLIGNEMQNQGYWRRYGDY